GDTRAIRARTRAGQTGTTCLRRAGQTGTCIASSTQRLPELPGQTFPKRRIAEVPDNCLPVQEFTGNHLAYVSGKDVALAGNYAGGKGYPQTENTVLLQWTEEHPNCNHVGDVANKGAQYN